MEAANDYRFVVVEKGLSTLTQEVSRLAGMMERLVSVEERNIQINQKIDMIEKQFQKDIARLEGVQSLVAKEITKLNQFAWKAAGAFLVFQILILPIIHLTIANYYK